MKLATTSLFLTCILTGCASLQSPPSAEKLANLPVVVYPDKPASPEYIYKLPAGKPIDLKLIVDGNALTQGVNQTVSTSLDHDIFLHKRWASADGQHWIAANQLRGVNFTMTLPSYETPVPGEMHLTVNHKPKQ